MSNNRTTPISLLGDIEIADEVLAIIAVTSALEVDGVTNTGSTNITEFFNKKHGTKCVNIEKIENSLNVNINITVNFGTKVIKVAQDVQEKVKSSLETMTGMEVLSVNVSVAGIVNEKTNKVTSEENI